jgi:predicted NBD/HSP70 family sugar kinase
MSRADLARILRLDRSTTGSLVDSLLGMGLLDERPSEGGHPTGRQGGRPPLLVGLIPEHGYIIGVDIRQDNIRVIAADLFGRPIFEHEMERASGIDSLTVEVGTIITSTVTSVRSCAPKFREGIPGLVGIGIAVSAIVDADAGTIQFSRSLGIHEPVQLAVLLEEEAPAPVYLFNDADACALAELEFVHTYERDLLFVLGRFEPPSARAGLGIVLDGNLRQSYSGVGREFRSPFANVHSSEQFAVSDLLAGGELSEAEAFAQYSEELAVSVAFLVHALDVRSVVLGGDLSGTEDRFGLMESKVHEHVRMDTARSAKQPLDLRRAEMAERSAAFGACAGALRRSFERRRFPLYRKELL